VLRSPFAPHGRLVGPARSPGGSSVCIPLADSSYSPRVVACGKCGNVGGDPSRTAGRRSRSRGRRTFGVRGGLSRRALAAPAPLLGPEFALLVEVAHPNDNGRLPRLSPGRDVAPASLSRRDHFSHRLSDTGLPGSVYVLTDRQSVSRPKCPGQCRSTPVAARAIGRTPDRPDEGRPRPTLGPAVQRQPASTAASQQ
jgi:hypothetical protein